MRESISIPKKHDSVKVAPEAVHQQSEGDAEKELDALLADPGNKFLQMPVHKSYIDDAAPQDALAYAWQRIEERLQRTFHYEYVQSVDGVMPERVSYRAMSHSIDAILRGAREIGRGGDAFVVIDKNEIRNLPPEICYKFAITEKTPRGRNDTFEEMKMQDAFYQVAKDGQTAIGIPIPFYAVEIGSKKVLAMEKLDAASIEDILRSKGMLPDWIDIDVLCAELTAAIDTFHEAGLFHRDMHFGNVMISQAASAADAEKIAYIIDFGLSARTTQEMEPYKKEVAGELFTYTDDYAIIEGVRSQLNQLRSRRRV